VRRFFVPAGAVSGGDIELPRELARRLHTVLRLKRGERIVLADGSGLDREAELTALSPRAGTARVLVERPSPPEPAVELVLYQSLVRPQRFDLVLEKGTELGVARFVPLLAGRGQVKAPGGEGRPDRWRRIVTEAAEQCGRGRLPAVDEPATLEDAVASAPGLRLLPWEGESASGGRGLRESLRGLAAPPEAVSLFIGPEGGFGPEEVERARKAGCLTVSLGARILRSETAGIVAAALVMGELGELGR
jgi:16S rRNA (uracil1498-N3)-methyltransferase